VIPNKEKFDLVNWEIVSVNPIDKNWSWTDLFCFWAISIQSIIGFSLIASLYLIYDLNFFVVFFGGLIAVLLTIFFSNLIGSPSQKYGLPFPVILRSSVGLNASRYVSLLRGIVGIFMFGVQTFFLSKALVYLIRIFLFSFEGNLLDKEIFLIFFLGLNIIDWSSLIITFYIQYTFFSMGHKVLKKIIKFSAIFVYFGLCLFFILTVGENFMPVINSLKLSLNFENFISKSNILPLITVAGTMFAYFSILILNFGDFSRYVKNKNQLIKGNYTLIINFILISFFSIFIVIGSDIILTKNNIPVENILTNPNDIIGKLNNTYLTVIVLIFVIVATASTNLIANYVPSQNSLINFLPSKLSLKSSGLIVLILSFIIGSFWLTLLSQIGVLSIIDTVGSFFGPIFGIIVADIFLIKKNNLDGKDFFNSKQNSAYFYSNGWQLKSLYALFIGFIFAASTIWNVNLNFLQSFSWIIGGLISLIIYYLLSD
tara:strand:- start:10 stop:1464 length:1455 start_codon:yes stop_codon:yes gene_type:complete